MSELLNERSKRGWAAAEARSHGRGGVAAVARATGMSETTVRRGLSELDAGEDLPAERVRPAGAGRGVVVFVGGVGRVERSCHSRRSGSAVAVDEQERGEARAGAAGEGARGR